MTLEDYNGFCRSLPHTSHVVQWGGAHVWKVAGKVFAIGWFEPGAEPQVTFKVSEMSFEMLKATPGCRPAPYLASRGMSWIQRFSSESMDDAGLRDYLAESHRIVAAGLPKKRQRELGFATAPDRPAPRTKHRSLSNIQRRSTESTRRTP